MTHPPAGPDTPPPPPRPRGTDPVYSVDQAAHLLGVHPMTVYRLIWDGELAWVNIGRGGKRPRIRIRQSAIDAYLSARDMAGAA